MSQRKSAKGCFHPLSFPHVPPSEAQLHPRSFRQAEVPTLDPFGADAATGRRGAQATPQPLRLHGRHRSRLLSPGDRQSLRRLEDEKALQGCCRRRRHPADPLSRLAPHLRHEDGRRWRAAAVHSGVDGPPRLQDDQIYADFAPNPSQEAGWAEAAFGEESDEEGDAPDDRDPDSSPETDG